MIKRVRIFLSQILVRVSTGPQHPFTNYILGTMKGQLKVVFEFFPILLFVIGLLDRKIGTRFTFVIWCFIFYHIFELTHQGLTVPVFLF